MISLFLAGQVHGEAWADVLLGDVNPSGKLPVTFPLNEDDVLAPCPWDNCAYGERLNVGWRALHGKPVAWPFGHGLSYTSFTYGWSDAGATLPAVVLCDAATAAPTVSSPRIMTRSCSHSVPKRSELILARSSTSYARA